jgi:hypothetical protein
MFTWPKCPGFADNRSNVLRTLLHLACQIEGRGNHEIRIGATDLNLNVQSSDIYLSCGESLLPHVDALSQLHELCISQIMGSLGLDATHAAGRRCSGGVGRAKDNAGLCSGRHLPGLAACRRASSWRTTSAGAELKTSSWQPWCRNSR